MLRLPAPSVGMSRRSASPSGLVFIILVVFGEVWVSRAMARRMVPDVPVASVREDKVLPSGIAALRQSLASVRASTEEAQLGVRVALPWLAEHGLPVTQRRLERSDALLSQVLAATARAESVLAASPASK